MRTTATRRTIILVALLLLLTPSQAIPGILSDALQPEIGIFSFDTGLEPYYMSVRNSLLGEHRYRMCQVLVIPSFEREWVVYIVREDGKPFEVVYKVMKTHLWHDMMAIIHKEPPDGPWPFDVATQTKALSVLGKEVERVSKPISEETANLLGRVWTAMLLRVQYPKPNDMMGLDGTQYYVSHFEQGKGVWSGTTWSPGPKTNPGVLIQIAEDLRNYATVQSSQQKILETKIAVKAKRLLVSLKSEAQEGKKRK